MSGAVVPMLATMIDWTQVIILGGPAYVAAIGGVAAALYAARNGRKLNTPSGGTIGRVVEEAAHVGHATNASVQQIHERLNGENVLPKRAPDA